jgi:hypothetical protein
MLPHYRYSLRVVPPIHIIVKDGNVTLVGTVSTKVESDIAGIATNAVSGIFCVTNNLGLENTAAAPIATPVEKTKTS